MQLSLHDRSTRFRQLIIFFLLLMPVSYPVCLIAQETNPPLINSTLSGRVADELTRLPLAGAVIKIKGTTHAVSAAENGSFNFITGQKFPYTLVISLVGYQTREVTANGSPVEVLLKEAVNKLNDLIVIGYGSQRKRDITGSISTVPTGNLHQLSPSVDNLLRGAAPGIQVTQSSGQPGASATVRIRGGNSITGGNEPLYVIDGFPVYNDNSAVTTSIASGPAVNALASINPSDIESVEILKDASATAIYGSRGANGVVIITTRKGKRGTGTVSYQGSYGVQQISKYLPMLNAGQWGRLHNDILASTGQQPSFTPAQLATLSQGTDWQSLIFRTAAVQSHELTLSGGDEKSRYAVAGNYLTQDGIVINTRFKRYGARVNYDRDLSSHFKTGVNITGTYLLSNSPANNTSGTTNASPNLFINSIITSPVVPLLNSDGTYFTANPYAAFPSNPVQDLKVVQNQTAVSRLLGNFFGEYQLLPGLKARVTAGADMLNTRQDYFAPSNSANGYSVQSYAAVGTKGVITWLNENTLTYDKILGRHLLSLLAGYTTQSAKESSVTSASQNFVNGSTGFNSLQSGAQALAPYSDSYNWALNSYLARINYSFDHKYNMTLSERADGSSRFGAGNKWGYFPSAGVSWNAGEEEFIKDFSMISDLKLRFSAGKTGNQEVGQYQSLSTLLPYNYDFSGKLVTGFAPSRLANPNLRWEKTIQYDAGADFGLLSNRVSFVADLYYKRTTDLLLNVPVPLSTGYAYSLQNIGSVENKGLELGLNTVNIQGELSWKSAIVYSMNRNKVLNLGATQSSFFSAVPSFTLGLLTPVIVKVGLPLNTFWGYRTAGLIQAGDDLTKIATIDPAGTRPGDRRYRDINRDGRITPADKVNLGNAQPKFIASFSNTFIYRGFDLLVFLQGSFGNKIYNALHQQLNITNLLGNAWGDIAGRWTVAHTNGNVPRASNAPVAQMSDYYIEDGSYLRLKTLTLGYTFSPGVLSYVRAKQLRVYLSVQNLVTWTKYTGYDPEVSSFEQTNGVQGIDYGAYPNYRTFLAGVSVTF